MLATASHKLQIFLAHFSAPSSVYLTTVRRCFERIINQIFYIVFAVGCDAIIRNEFVIVINQL